MPLQRNAPSLSIVIELENIEATGADRTIANLNELQRQLEACSNYLDGQTAIKIVYDSSVHSKSDAERFIRDTGLAGNRHVKCESIGKPGIHYYEHKNVGMQICQSDIVLFMDSDILIEADWLNQIVSAFEHDHVNFVSGRSYIETPRFFDKIYALTDPGFPLEERRLAKQQRQLAETDLIMANAFAFRRSKVSGDLFPQIEAYRGHCGVAAQRLIRQGEVLHIQPNAVARHPSLDGFGSYFARAFAEGCDAIQHSRFNRKPGLRGLATRTLIGSVYRLGKGTSKMVQRSWNRRGDVGMPAFGVPVTIACGTGYFLARFAGEVTTLINARLALRWSIAKTAH